MVTAIVKLIKIAAPVSYVLTVDMQKSYIQQQYNRGGQTEQRHSDGRVQRKAIFFTYPRVYLYVPLLRLTLRGYRYYKWRYPDCNTEPLEIKILMRMRNVEYIIAQRYSHNK